MGTEFIKGIPKEKGYYWVKETYDSLLQKYENPGKYTPRGLRLFAKKAKPAEEAYLTYVSPFKWKGVWNAVEGYYQSDDKESFEYNDPHELLFKKAEVSKEENKLREQVSMALEYGHFLKVIDEEGNTTSPELNKLDNLTENKGVKVIAVCRKCGEEYKFDNINQDCCSCPKCKAEHPNVKITNEGISWEQ